MVKRRVGGLVKAYVFSYLYCFYRIVALGCMDGMIMKSQNIAIWVALANANRNIRNIEVEGDYAVLYLVIMIIAIVIGVWIALKGD